MSVPSVKRKLAAILSADVKGYSRLMQEDEVGTVRTLNAYKEVMSVSIRGHGGRVVDAPGDNLLAEFGSVVDAVQCAVEIQRELKGRNAELPETRRMEFRMGINLGDVIEEGDRIYGDGVNLAARMEGLAEGGGICVSGTVYDHVRNKIAEGFDFLGEHAVKNIAEPVRVYGVEIEAEAKAEAETTASRKAQGARRRPLAVIVAAAVGVVVLLGGGAAFWEFVFRPSSPTVEKADQKKMAFPLPERPSIAVLPFTNLSEDPKHEHFVDGMTEEIITTLSKVSGLFVIASNSVFTYKRKPVKVQQVSQELGVRYVLEGSVRRSEDRVRVTAQLIDAITGHHLWAERYDRVLKDVFSVQDDITQRIVTALQVKLTEGEQARVRRQTTTNVEAWEHYSKGLEQSRMVTKAGNAEAQRMLEAAVALDPNFAAAWALLAATHMLDAWLGWTLSPAKSLDRAVELARKAIALDDSLGEPHMTLGAVHLLRQQHDEAISASERAVALNPNSATITVYLGRTLSFSGRPGEAIEVVKRAMRLSPNYPAYYLVFLAHAYRAAGRYEEAIEAAQKWIEINPEAAKVTMYPSLAVCYTLSGREAEARAAVAELLRSDPGFSLERARRMWPYKNSADLDRELHALRKLGLPETPPPLLPDKPSIAVLPFANMSDDPQQEVFGDGLAEEIINALAKLSQLFVIARNSSFKYKGKTVDVRQAGRELGVKYVLEGSVRRDAQRVRVTAQLIESSTGKHLFSERYDRELKEIFATQDEITLAIVRAMRVTLTSGEQARLIGKGTKNLDAYLKAIQANEQFLLMNRQGSIKAKEFAREAIALDPNYANPYAILAWTHMLDVWFRFSESPEESMRFGSEAAHKARALDDSDPSVFGALTSLSIMQREHDKSIAFAERGLELSPGGAHAHSSMGSALHWACRFPEAISFFEQSIRLDPYPSATRFRMLAGAYAVVGRHDEALKAYEKALQLNPDDIFAHLGLAALLMELEREEAAQAEAREVLKLHPRFSLDHFAKTLTYKDQAVIDQRIEFLRKAGLK